ncbi:MAG TPA: hypothetical protein VGO11_21450 [Chthoniobacteraceae bacterium]|jgi:hypothetical protein|nr:hypothetical protein [Chthoniobacteraceae bacterium]
MPNAENTPHLQAEELAEYFEDRLPEERQGEIQEHLADCAACLALGRQARVFTEAWSEWTAAAHGRASRARLWEARPVWTPPAQASGVAGKIVKRLAEGLRLLVGRAGDLLEAGLGPPSRVPAVAGGMMSVEELPRAEAPPKEWLLADEEAGCEIRIAVRGDASGRAMLSCALEGAAATTPPLDRVRIEIKSAQTGALMLAGRLSDFQRTPMTVGPGSWEITLETREVATPRTWILPLQIAPEGAE